MFPDITTPHTDAVDRIVAPEFAYDDLEVADGGMAMDAFARLLDTDISDSERVQLRNALLHYCKRDTLAMVRIAQYFQGNHVQDS